MALPSLAPGTRLGSYEIERLLDSGSRGDVYLAKDLRLNRDVAVKLIHEDAAKDEEWLRSFEQAARSVAALNHPNVITIYDVERHGVTLYISMELVEGGTLRAKLDASPLSTRELLSIGTQVADALAKAHAHGIVHGAVKPDNVMLSRDGFAKVLGFGESQVSVRSENVSVSERSTEQTPRSDAPEADLYASPEQAGGLRFDFRSDQFSLGRILFEMVVGPQTFLSERAALLDHAPRPITALNPEAPQSLGVIVERCLTKEPEDRYDSTRDLARALKAVRDSGIGMRAASPAKTSTRRVRNAAAAVTVLLCLTVLLGYFFLGQEETIFRFTNSVQVTTATGVEDYPNWSPDGSMLVYQSNQRGNWDIWVKHFGSGPPLNRTEVESAHDRFPSWSPDGRQIAFFSEREGQGYFVMSPLAGIPNKVIDVPTEQFQASAPQWSADGTKLAGVIGDRTGQFVEIVSTDTGESRRLELPGRSLARFDLSWSPDDLYFAYVDSHAINANVTQLRVLRMADGKSSAVTDGRTNDRSPHWSSDGRTLYFLSNRGGSMDLWQQRIRDDGTPDGAARPMTTGIGMQHADFSPDRKRLAYSKGRRVANVWQVPIYPDRPATWADALQITFEQAFIEHVDPSPDGRHLLVSSDRRGNPDLWMISFDGGDIQQMTSDPTPDWAPKWSPDGTEIAFYAHRSGNRDIWVMPRDGGPARQLTRDKAEDLDPTWSPDGTEIGFYSDRSGNWDIWVVPASGGDARQLTTDGAMDHFSHWSPGGDTLAFHSNRTGQSRLWQVPAAGGEAVPLSQGPASIPRWSPDASYVYFSGAEERAGSLWELSVDDGSERPVANLVGRRGNLGTDSIATDGRQLFFIWEEDQSDLWVMDVATDGGR